MLPSARWLLKIPYAGSKFVFDNRLITLGRNNTELLKAGWASIHHFQVKLNPEDDSYCKAPSTYNPMLNRTQYLHEKLSVAFGPLKNHVADNSLTSPMINLIASYLTFDDRTGRREYALKKVTWPTIIRSKDALVTAESFFSLH